MCRSEMRGNTNGSLLPQALHMCVSRLSGHCLLVVAAVPGIQSGSLRKALLLGGFFGLVTYATYDLTNLATVKNWPWIVTVVDLVWGALLSTSVSCIAYFAGRWLR